MRDLKVYLSIAFLLLGLYLVVQYNMPRPVDWRETFSRKDKIPFGTYVVYERLRDIFPNADVRFFRESPYIVLKDKEVKEGSYIIIAPSVKVDMYDFLELKKYMEKGNDVFIASYYLSQYIEDSLKTKVNTRLKIDKKEKTLIRFVNPQLNPQKEYSFEKGIGDQFFSSYDTSRVVVLGVNKTGKVNFIKYKYGKGNMYILASPFFFSNFNLLNPQGAEYASNALSYLRSSKEVVWDEFSALGAEEEGGHMRVFFKYKELRWAYYVALFGMAFYLVFQLKRRQRIIPVIEPLKNTSAEFAEVVGQVYYQQRDNSNIARKMVTYFLEEIRSKYNIKTNQLDKEFAQLLANKSGVQPELVNDLVRQMLQMEKFQSVTDQDLIELNKNIEQFQKQSK